MGLNLCRDQRKTNLVYAISDIGNDDHLDINRIRQNTQSANIGNILKTMETNQHDSYLSVDAEMKPASVSMESPDEMSDDHISTKFSDQKTSHPSKDEADDLVNSAYFDRATSEERSLGKKDNVNQIREVVSPIDDWGKEAEILVNGSEDLLCSMSLPLLNLDIPELKQKSYSDVPVPKKDITKREPSLYRSSSSAKWTVGRITKESDAMRKKLSNMLDEVKDFSTDSVDSPTSLETSISSDENEDVKQGEKSTCLKDASQWNKSNETKFKGVGDGLSVKTELGSLY